ncbi:MAG: phosphotransferase [Anaerolineaceae bacterium]|nr:phosphotransferase [Anaerolineaceae bacterium]MCB9100661.1 phosphotransferase [Anaerolineales bacterium]
MPKPTPPDNINIIDEKLSLTAEQKQIIRRNLPHAAQIDVKRLLGGSLQGTLVLLVGVKRADGFFEVNRAIKFGDKASLREEYESYERYILNSDIQDIAARINTPTSASGINPAQMALVYSAIAGESFEAYYAKHDASELLGVLNKLFGPLVKYWRKNDKLVEKPHADNLFYILRKLFELIPKYWRKKDKPVIESSSEHALDEYYGAKFPPHLTIKDPQPGPAPKQLGAIKLTGEVGLANSNYERLTTGMVELNNFTLHRRRGYRLELRRPNRPGKLRITLVGVPRLLEQQLLNNGPIALYGEVIAHRHRDYVERMTAAFAKVNVAIDLDPAKQELHLDGQTYPNPLHYYLNYLNKSLNTSPVIVHGDMHTGNIIVNEHGYPKLIDFEAVDRGHWALDFVTLERNLRHVAAEERKNQNKPPFTVAELIDFEERLLLQTIAPSRRPVVPPPDLDLAKLFTVIGAIRQHAIDFMGLAQVEPEYLPALMLHLLAALKFQNTPDKYATARHQFIAAVVALTYLETHDLPQVEEQTPPTDPQSHRCDFYAHISLPPNYVPRPELLASIKQTLLGERQDVALTSALKTSAVHGMGGIGKSVMARALCDEPDIQATFKDGILWTTLGQTVSDDDLKAKLRAWIEELGGIISATAPSLNQLKNNLAEQLKARACLLIVDDMWRYEDADWFNGGGPNCRLLLTTRDAEAARQLGAAIAPVETMRESEALELLSQWAGRPLQQSHPKPAAQIVKRLGYLPLALKLAGEQLRRQEPTAWLAGFKAQKLKSRRDKSVYGNLFDTFALSLTALTDEEQPLYTSLVIFKEDEPILRPAIAMLWSQLANYDPDASEAFLFDLADRALLQVSDDNKTVLLHDLVREFMAEQLPEEAQRHVHTRLLNGYRATQTGEGWATAPDDGYLYSHLAYHLDILAEGDETAAGELNHLFADDAWLQVRVAADGYRYDGYLSDLELAWQRANHVTRKQIAADQAPDGLGEWVHYALIQSSINTLAGQYPPALVAQAVTTHQWTVERAISVAANIVDPQARFTMGMQLLQLDKLPSQAYRQVGRITLAAAQAIGDERVGPAAERGVAGPGASGGAGHRR